MKLLKIIKESLNKNNHLFKINKAEIKQYNTETISKTFIITAVITIVPLIFAIFRRSMVETIPIYLMATTTIIVLYLLYQIKRFQKYPLVFVYIFATCLFVLVAYLSLVQFDDRPAGVALTFFTILPLLIIDKPLRFNMFTLVLYSIHASLSFIIKGTTLGGIDLLNTFISLVIGILFGRLFLTSRLNNLEMKRLLNIEKETDFLTGLYNRRKLFTDFKVTIKQETSIGILMIDIDEFKLYNDSYGHQAGDECLIKLGNIFKAFGSEYNIKFYRYGGEEFIGVLYINNKEALYDLANKIRIEANMIPLLDSKISISIGLSFNDKYNSLDQLDQLILMADKALYEVKDNGGNGVAPNFKSE